LRLAEWGQTFILHGNNPQDRMSAWGQKRIFREVETMSALPQKADIARWPAVRLHHDGAPFIAPDQ
jgi:hypothetical protein